MTNDICKNTNTFMRFGEITNLKWNMCKTYKYKNQQMLEINLPASICKNKKSRTIVTIGGQYLKRIKKWSKWTEPEDYVFSDYMRNVKVERTSLYRTWHELLKYTQMDDLRKDNGEKRIISFYSLRHLGITFRLMSGHDIYQVSELAGTEVRFIQNHYSHLPIAKMRENALKTFKTTADGAVVPLLADEREIIDVESKLR